MDTLKTSIVILVVYEDALKLVFNTLYESKLLMPEINYHYASSFKSNGHNIPLFAINRKRSRFKISLNAFPGDFVELNKIINHKALTYDIWAYNSSEEKEKFITLLLRLGKKYNFRIIESIGRGFETVYKLLG